MNFQQRNNQVTENEPIIWEKHEQTRNNAKLGKRGSGAKWISILSYHFTWKCTKQAPFTCSSSESLYISQGIIPCDNLSFAVHRCGTAIINIQYMIHWLWSSRLLHILHNLFVCNHWMVLYVPSPCFILGQVKIFVVTFLVNLQAKSNNTKLIMVTGITLSNSFDLLKKHFIPPFR